MRRIVGVKGKGSLRRCFGLALAGLSAGAFLVFPIARAAAASDVGDFYRGRQITILVGFSAGGGFDLYARLLAQHLGDYMPGHPRVVVQNMPGSGSLTAALDILDVAPKDGTVIGTFVSQVPLLPILSDATFDGSRFNWIGSVTSDNYVCVASARSQVKNWADMLTKTFVAAKIRLVTGYPGTNDVKAAMLRGEVDGECGLSYSTLQTGYAQELASKEINVLVQVSLSKNPELADVPVAGDFATPEQKEVLGLIMAPNALARPFAAPPGVPADRLDALRTAFDQATADPTFLADAKRANLDVQPMRGTDITKMVHDLYATPKNIVDQAKAAIAVSR
jgi:tripartite-type tricarboxylate transporter receptor subunit TctC